MAIMENIEGIITMLRTFMTNTDENDGWLMSHHKPSLEELIQDSLDNPKRQTVFVAQMKNILRKYDDSPFRTRKATISLTGEALALYNRIKSAFADIDLGDDADFFLDTVTPKSSKKNPNPRYESVQDAIQGKILNAVERSLLDEQRGEN